MTQCTPSPVRPGANMRVLEVASKRYGHDAFQHHEIRQVRPKLPHIVELAGHPRAELAHGMRCKTLEGGSVKGILGEDGPWLRGQQRTGDCMATSAAKTQPSTCSTRYWCRCTDVLGTDCLPGSREAVQPWQPGSSGHASTGQPVARQIRAAGTGEGADGMARPVSPVCGRSLAGGQVPCAPGRNRTRRLPSCVIGARRG